MFRIRVRIDPERARDHATSVRSGLPGRLCQDRSRGRLDAGVARDARMTAMDVASMVRLRRLRHDYGRVRALDFCRRRHPGRLHGRTDRPRRRRQIDAARPHRRGESVAAGRRRSPRRRHRRIRAGATRCVRGSPICRRAWARTSIPISPSRKTSTFFSRLYDQSRSEGAARAKSLMRDTGLDLRRPAGEQAVRRHATKARPLLFTDSRSRTAHPRRADDRRRPLVASSVLGIGRADAPSLRR